MMEAVNVQAKSVGLQAEVPDVPGQMQCLGKIWPSALRIT